MSGWASCLTKLKRTTPTSGWVSIEGSLVEITQLMVGLVKGSVLEKNQIMVGLDL